VPVTTPLAKMLEAHRLRSGNPARGPVFANGAGKPLDMNNLLDRQILPAPRRCAHCKKSEAKHNKADHAFELDKSMPVWQGRHAFRRGLATNLHRLGVPDKHIQHILRHSNVAVTQACYIKTVPPDSAAAMRRLEAVTEAVQ
jgi:integrase